MSEYDAAFLTGVAFIGYAVSGLLLAGVPLVTVSLLFGIIIVFGDDEVKE